MRIKSSDLGIVLPLETRCALSLQHYHVTQNQEQLKNLIQINITKSKHE